MSLKGGAAVAIWHDLLPEATDEFLQWHNREHMPERMAIPGFSRGRRYAVAGDGPAYFNLYEADSLAVLGGPDYLARLDNPTDWTRATVASFRDVARSACVVRFTAGPGAGGVMTTLRFDAPALHPVIIDRLLPPLIGMVGIAGVHFLVDDSATSNIETRERAARGEAAVVPADIVLIEGVSGAHVAAAAADFVAALTEAAPITVRRATYRLEHATESAHR